MKLAGMTGASKAVLTAYVIGGLSAALAAWFGAALIWAGEAGRHRALDHCAGDTEFIAAPAPLSPEPQMIVIIVNRFSAATTPATRPPPVICGTGRCRRVDWSSFFEKIHERR